ncbi:MAG: hypothetical protein E7258_08030 [Lachnospiraceae bacterium]|nr:hypothetical protein [Lachnospiraceae bacterium]
MKRIIKNLYCIAAIAIVIFVIALFVAGSDAIRWRVFSITMPIAAIGFWGAIILSVIDYIKTKNDSR